MSLTVSRTCTELNAADEDRLRERDSRPLASYRDEPAYVLLGDPGAGKTTAFRTECEALGAEALFITARDFTTFDPDDRPEWRGKTLFIDGLDEIRVDAVNARTPFDEIRARLDKLGKPRFRLSCRHADWLGRNDRRHLVSVSPQDSQVKVLGIDPLSETQVAQIVSARTRIYDVNEFILKARETGIADLLENPQTLLLLADVRDREGAWPTSRLGLFDKACALTIKETNEEHSIALHRPPTPELLDAAGRLCAVLLVSGAVGYARGQHHACDDYLKPEQCGYPYPDLVERALSTKLFTAAHEGHFIPVHRHIAEFLAAKHLCRAIDDRLPARRVIALLAGENGITATGLRGLSAWLAALCTRARPELIERDPIGVACYGDVRGFARAERERLLRGLSRESHQIHSVAWTQSTAGALVTADMEPVLSSVLESRSNVRPVLLEFVLATLKWGTPLPGIADHLLEIARERHRWSQFQRMALEAFIHNRTDDDAMVRELLQLLEDISAGRVPDNEGKLTAVALRRLYPESISPSALWGYLKEAISRSVPLYSTFWKSLLVERSTDTCIAELLDDLVARGSDLRHILSRRRFENLSSELLARGVEVHGDKIATKRLVDWLLVARVSGNHRPSHDAIQRIRTWLQERPNTQKSVIEDWVNRCCETDVAPGVDNLLYGAPLPSDFGVWCLEHAEQATDVRVARFYLAEASSRGISIEVLWERTRNSALLRDAIRELLVVALPPGYFEGVHERRSCLEESERRRQEFVDLVRSNAIALRDNRCNARLLHNLGQAYFGTISDFEGDDPSARLDDLLNSDAALIDAVLTGFRGTPFREDIPEPDGIIRLMKSDQEFLVALPFLAGIDELEDMSRLTENQLRQALAFHYCTSVEAPHNRERRLLETDPEIGAEMLIKCVSAKMRNGMFDYATDRLATDDWRSVARRVALPLLRSVPLRVALPATMTTLDDLFIASFRFADRAELLTLVAEKLSRASMTATQRVHWLAAEVVGAPETCPDRLQTFVQRHENRAAQLGKFLFRARPLLDDLPTRTLACFITLLAPLTRVLGRTMTPLIETEYNATRTVAQMIQALTQRSGSDADVQLELLARDPEMAQWRETLTVAVDHTRSIRRDAAYRHPTAEQVCRTLSGGPPTNAADLAALTVDTLRDLALRIRAGNTDDWRQYWNEPHGEDPTPKHEDQCRDALLSDLRQCLPGGVDAQPEGQYANDKRSDIRVAYDCFGILLEIKKSPHRNLWSAVRKQLIDQYTVEPATDGYGIYLVFWFGRDCTQAPPSGSPPVSAEELQGRLEDSLSDSEPRRISVVVIDVSRPT